MAWDVTELAAAARRLDGSAALRAFALPLAIIGVGASVGLSVAQSFESDFDQVPVLILLAVTSLLLTALSLLLTVFSDALARQPMRRVSATIALIAGLIFQALMVIVVAGVTVLLVSFLTSADAREQIGATFADLFGGQSWRDVTPVLQSIMFGVYAWLAWRTVRIETVMASSTPRALLLGDIGGAGFWPRLAYLFGLPSSLWHSRALRTPAFWLFILARAVTYGGVLVATGVAFALAGSLGMLSDLILPGILLALVLFGGGHLIFLAAKRLAARRIWRDDPSVEAGPILFLRSFRDNQFRFHTAWYDLPGRWMELWTFRRNADEMLVDEFAWYGPVIALGQPGERHAPFGADRRYVDHDNWQQVVADAAARAHAIIVAAGETPGLAWEYNLIAERGFADKTVFLFPPAAAGAAEADRAVRLFNQAFPATPVRLPESGSLVAAIISETGAREVIAHSPSAQAYLVALRRFLQVREEKIGRPVGDRPLPLGWIAMGIALPVLLFIASGVLAEF